jgi:hypothetical protein
LGSGARAAAIAAHRGPSDPLAAQHLAIDALAHRRHPAVDRTHFSQLTPWGQAVAVFHQCVLGAQGRTLMGWMQQADAAFLSWAARECANH